MLKQRQLTMPLGFEFGLGLRQAHNRENYPALNDLNAHFRPLSAIKVFGTVHSSAHFAWDDRVSASKIFVPEQFFGGSGANTRNTHNHFVGRCLDIDGEMWLITNRPSQFWV